MTALPRERCAHCGKTDLRAVMLRCAHCGRWLCWESDCDHGGNALAGCIPEHSCTSDAPDPGAAVAERSYGDMVVATLAGEPHPSAPLPTAPPRPGDRGFDRWLHQFNTAKTKRADEAVIAFRPAPLSRPHARRHHA